MAHDLVGVLDAVASKLGDVNKAVLEAGDVYEDAVALNRADLTLVDAEDLRRWPISTSAASASASATASSSSSFSSFSRCPGGL